MECPKCKDRALRRMKRQGFLRESVYPLFGYYPWQRRSCKAEILLKSRGQRKKRLSPQHSAGD